MERSDSVRQFRKWVVLFGVALLITAVLFNFRSMWIFRILNDIGGMLGSPMVMPEDSSIFWLIFANAYWAMMLAVCIKMIINIEQYIHLTQFIIGSHLILALTALFLFKEA